MAWSSSKNDIFFRRVQNWSAALINLLEERDRLIDLYTNEANGDPAFTDTSIATTAELIATAGVMNALDAMINNGDSGSYAASDPVPCRSGVTNGWSLVCR